MLCVKANNDGIAMINILVLQRCMLYTTLKFKDRPMTEPYLGIIFFLSEIPDKTTIWSFRESIAQA
ncbi:hypothetical protein [Methanosalsum natronophilum]|uniref:hypothetical protein n=1 Tax=Methanosalsum natronophilum TaxID=768733 RepID=UPI0021696323|nr:hypothetical protein [Methanosalsum natronophilum]